MEQIYTNTNPNAIYINAGLVILTSIATTLLVEYFAKPRLEARKNRIIRDRNQIDEVIFAFQELGLVLGILQVKDIKLTSNINHYLLTNTAQAEDIIQRLQTNIARLQLKYVLSIKGHLPAIMMLLGYIKSQLYLLAPELKSNNTKGIKAIASELEGLAEDVHLADHPLELSRHNWFTRKLHHKRVRASSAELISNLKKRGLSSS